MPALRPSRRTRVSAVLALILACPFASASSAQQQNSGAASDQKPADAGAAHHTSAKPSTSHSTTGKKSSRKKKSTRLKGQQKIDSDRARSIQEALIREHYLNGEPSGSWNQQSEDAMRKYQADHGWQSKTVPDSRALISLGLGPSHDHLLNPESAMTTGPATPRSASPQPTSQTSTPASSAPAPTSTPSDPPNH